MSFPNLNPTGRGIGRQTRLRVVLRGLLLRLLLSLLLVAGSAGASEVARLDLNRATAAQLESLPGIGSSKAAAIVAAREQSGGFRSVDELEGVRGIGPALIEKLRPLVQVGSGSGSASRPSTGSGSPAGSSPVVREKKAE